MKNALAAMAITVIASASAYADTGIEGNYKYTGRECSSGATPQPIFSGGMSGGYSMDVAISSSQLTSSISIQYKMDAAVSADYIKQIQDAMTAVQKQPDSPEKQKNLADLQKSLDDINHSVAGFSCNEVEVMNYSLSGSTLHIVPVSVTGNCQVQAPPEPSDSTIQISGNVLKSSMPQSDSETSCPKGDNVISVFEKIN